MTDRERLIQLIKQAEKEFSDTGKPVLDIEEFVTDYLLKNGVIVPPCKVGDTVYCLDDLVDEECRYCEHYLIGGFGDPSECSRTKYGFKHPDCIEITEEVITQQDILFSLCFNKFGNSVFLTREEAEKALAERSVNIVS